MRRRVVITGAGIVSTNGIGVEKFWRNCLDAKTTVAPIPARWSSYAAPRSRIWSPLPDFNSESMGIGRAEQLQLDQVTVLALVATREALENAGFVPVSVNGSSRVFKLPGTDDSRTGVFLGTGLGGANTFLQNHTYHLLHGPRADLLDYAEKHAPAGDREKLQNILSLTNHGPRFNPFEVSMVMPNASAAAIAIRYSITGPNTTYCVACASGTIAIGNAYRAVREGTVDVAISGGCEYFGDEHGHIFHSFDVTGALLRECADPTTANRPFDEKRSGFLFAQGGAAILVLEELEHAKRRRANIVAEVGGYSESFDAYSMMRLAPGGQQIENMLNMALADASVHAHEVDYINAHGTGTVNNDETEADVIQRVFGKSVRVNSTKSLVGHAIGASGAIEILVTALSLRDQTTHICKNLDNPLRDLNFVRSSGPMHLRVGLSQSFAFGGHNAAVVLSQSA